MFLLRELVVQDTAGNWVYGATCAFPRAAHEPSVHFSNLVCVSVGRRRGFCGPDGPQFGVKTIEVRATPRKTEIVLTYDDVTSERKQLNDSSADRVMAMSDLTASINHAKRTVPELKHSHYAI